MCWKDLIHVFCVVATMFINNLLYKKKTEKGQKSSFNKLPITLIIVSSKSSKTKSPMQGTVLDRKISVFDEIFPF